MCFAFECVCELHSIQFRPPNESFIKKVMLLFIWFFFLLFSIIYLRFPVENAPWMSRARQSLTVLWSPILWLPVWVCILYLIRQMIYRQTGMYSLAFLYNDLSVRLCARGRVDFIQHCIALIHYIHECGALLQ